MIVLAETAPEVWVSDAEYARLLGYPRGWTFEGRAAELAGWARDWYRANGRPWMYARPVEAVDVTRVLSVGGATFNSPRVFDAFRQSGASLAFVAAVSAGPELERQAHRLWEEERPDEYFFLEVFGSAVVEQLVTMTGARLCAWADANGFAVLPHYSPGYPEWDISEQRQLRDLIAADVTLPGVVEVLESGALRPKKSLLALFGATPHVDRVQRLTDLVPCQHCSFLECQYRRAPYSRAIEPVRVPASAAARFSDDVDTGPGAAVERVVTDAKYTVNRRALERWASERLSVIDRPDGGVDACFRYDGTTCTNMGRPLKFRYRVTLGPREDGYPIRDQRCEPADGDCGYTYMCEYIKEGRPLMEAVENDRPLAGQPLNAVLSWPRAAAAPACYCDPESRLHKWGLVLETIHYALSQRRGDGRRDEGDAERER